VDYSGCNNLNPELIWDTLENPIQNIVNEHREMDGKEITILSDNYCKRSTKEFLPNLLINFNEDDLGKKLTKDLTDRINIFFKKSVKIYRLQYYMYIL